MTTHNASHFKNEGVKIFLKNKQFDLFVDTYLRNVKLDQDHVVCAFMVFACVQEVQCPVFVPTALHLI